MLKTVKISILTLCFILFFQLFVSGENNIINDLTITNNGLIYINLLKKVDQRIKEYIKAGIPFNVSIEVRLKKYSGFFFLKDKTIKVSENVFKFSYDIIKKKYILISHNTVESFRDYNTFLKKISIIKINNFINRKKIIDKKDYYLDITVAYTPIKGNFTIKDIYIFPKIEKFIYKKRTKLEE